MELKVRAIIWYCMKEVSKRINYFTGNWSSEFLFKARSQSLEVMQGRIDTIRKEVKMQDVQ